MLDLNVHKDRTRSTDELNSLVGTKVKTPRPIPLGNFEIMHLDENLAMSI